MDSDPEVTYYALLDDDGAISGILRRRHIRPVPIDETFRRDLSWQSSEFLRKYYLGHTDSDYKEIAPEDAARIIAEWTRKWARE